MKRSILFIILFCAASSSFAQKSIERKTYSWISINSNLFLNKNWFIMADLHLRENNFFQTNSFVCIRGGIGYQVDENLSIAIGYGNLLATPTVAGYHTKSDEDRIYEQLIFSSSYKKIKILQRLRNEQRWQDNVVNDVKATQRKFSDRVRYLLSFNVPVFKKSTLPQLSFSDEVLLQFGKDVINNPFDQNRIFIGIKENISHNLVFDLGYMNFFQQKSTPNNYLKGDVMRLFLYYTLPAKHS